MENLPRPGIESMSPSLAGGFFSTEPSGKPHKFFLKIFHFLENPLFFINIPKQYNYLDYTSLFKIFKSQDILSFRYNICIKDVLIDISAMKPQNSLFLKAHLLILKVFLRIVFQLIIFYIVFG